MNLTIDVMAATGGTPLKRDFVLTITENDHSNQIYLKYSGLDSKALLEVLLELATHFRGNESLNEAPLIGVHYKEKIDAGGDEEDENLAPEGGAGLQDRAG